MLAVFPCVRAERRLHIRQRWSRSLLKGLGITLRPGGHPVRPGCMLVANHISWIDVFVINAIAPAAFVAKAEVRRWPLIGWLAARNETVFLRRGSRGHARIINAEIAALLDAGRNVALFPEGTTTDGSHLLHFHAALLQPAIAAGHPIQPVALAYRQPDGRPSRAPAYVGDISLARCVANIVAANGLVAHLDACPPIDTRNASRKELARDAHQAIARLVTDAADQATSPRPQ